MLQKQGNGAADSEFCDRMAFGLTEKTIYFSQGVLYRATTV